jgi:hypothetical protein
MLALYSTLVRMFEEEIIFFGRARRGSLTNQTSGENRTMRLINAVPKHQYIREWVVVMLCSHYAVKHRNKGTGQRAKSQGRGSREGRLRVVPNCVFSCPCRLPPGVDNEFIKKSIFYSDTGYQGEHSRTSGAFLKEVISQDRRDSDPALSSN